MRRPPLMTLPDPEWLALLRAEVGKPGKSISSVAGEIGMPRPSLSMLLSGKYPAKLDKVAAKFAAKVLKQYADQVYCPHLHRGIGRELCEHHATRPMSISNPDRLKQHLACLQCPLNPTKSDEVGITPEGKSDV